MMRKTKCRRQQHNGHTAPNNQQHKKAVGRIVQQCHVAKTPPSPHAKRKRQEKKSAPKPLIVQNAASEYRVHPACLDIRIHKTVPGAESTAGSPTRGPPSQGAPPVPAKEYLGTGGEKEIVNIDANIKTTTAIQNTGPSIANHIP